MAARSSILKIAIRLFALATVGGLTTNAYACPGSNWLHRDHAKNADFVFIGTVENFRWSERQSNHDLSESFPYVVRFKVLETLKGEHRSFWELNHYHPRLFRQEGKIVNRASIGDWMLYRNEQKKLLEEERTDKTQAIIPKPTLPEYINEIIVAGIWPDISKQQQLIESDYGEAGLPVILYELCSEPFLLSADETTIDEIKTELDLHHDQSH